MPVISLSNGFTARGMDRCCVAICCTRVYPCAVDHDGDFLAGTAIFRAQHIELDGTKLRRKCFDQLRRDRNKCGNE